MPAIAAGGAHLVDDSEVETAGRCHVEAWLSDASFDSEHANVGIGCTAGALPMLELGIAAAHVSAPGDDDTLIAFTPKATLRRAETGLGVAVAGSLGYGLDRSRLETASFIGAATLPAVASVTVNLNAGWVWSEAGRGSELFVGAQVEWVVRPGLALMAEGVTRNHDKAGWQAGVRWTPESGRIDVDLLAGRYVDGVTPTSLTLGLTIRP